MQFNPRARDFNFAKEVDPPQELSSSVADDSNYADG